MDETVKSVRRRLATRRGALAGVGLLVASLALTACGSSGGGSSGGKTGGSLILKTLSNPYFVSMEKDAKTEASKDGVSLTVAAGKTDGDTQSQISAIDNAISRGDKGILITINGDAVKLPFVHDSPLTNGRQGITPIDSIDLPTKRRKITRPLSGTF